MLSGYPSATLARFAAELRFEQIPEAVGGEFMCKRRIGV